MTAAEEDLKQLEDQTEKEKPALDKNGDEGSNLTEPDDNIIDTEKKLLSFPAAISAIGTASMAAWHHLDDVYDNTTSKTGATGKRKKS